MSNSEKMTVEEKLVQHLKKVGLGQLIEDEDDRKPACNQLPLAAQVAAPALSTEAQRAQTVGCVGSLPT